MGRVKLISNLINFKTMKCKIKPVVIILILLISTINHSFSQDLNKYTVLNAESVERIITTNIKQDKNDFDGLISGLNFSFDFSNSLITQEVFFSLLKSNDFLIDISSTINGFCFYVDKQKQHNFLDILKIESQKQGILVDFKNEQILKLK